AIPATFRDPAAPRERAPASVAATWIWGGVAGLMALTALLVIQRRRRLREAVSRPLPPSAHR
ncbi:hypothetical protein, partial [Duganella callida]|uniref:hypothetical protein n=1 Tax=Duganella callida TaxID=2561932 RepID=UPI00143178B8